MQSRGLSLQSMRRAMLAALGMRCAALAPRLRAARRLATPARLAPSPLDEDFLLPDRDGDGFGERPPPRRRETQKLCYKCGEPGHLARDCPSDAGGGDFQRTRVFVAGLDPAVQWYDLKDFFREAGFDVVYASVSAHADGSSKGCGVVQLASAEACDAAIRDLNGAALHGAAIAVREDRQERRRRGRGEAPPRATARDAFSDRRGAFDEFGGLLPWVGAENGPLPAEVLALLADRDDARDAKDYSAADAIRDDVRDLYELRIDDRNRRCLPHAPPVAPRAPPTATVKAEGDEAVVAALAGDVSFLDAPAEEATFDVSDIDLDSILAKHGDAMRAALAEDAAPDTVASAAAPDASAEDRDALAALRVPELKDRCRAAGLKVGGKKAELIDRLLGVE